MAMTTPLQDSIDADLPIPDRQPSPNRSRSPRIVRLTRTECARLLARNHVGRLAYAFRDLVDIVPLHYTYADGWIYARTSAGKKISQLQHHRWVAFEVDEVHGLFDWQSVVVHGALYLLSPESAAPEVWETAVAKLREYVPEAFTERDPVNFRTIVFRIHLDSVSGRRATPPAR